MEGLGRNEEVKRWRQNESPFRRAHHYRAIQTKDFSRLRRACVEDPVVLGVVIGSGDREW